MDEKGTLEVERLELLTRVEAWLETPMVVLGFVWLALLVAEFVWGTSALFEGIGTIIWIIFILDFGLKLTLAPHKLRYLRNNLLTVVALFIPALRIFKRETQLGQGLDHDLRIENTHHQLFAECRR